MRTQPQEIIRQLEADNSRLAKEAVIQSAMEEGLDEFFEGVKMALDPLVTFGVKQVPEKEENEVLSPQGLAWPTFKELTRKLIDRQLTGHNARDAIILCKDLATAEQWNMFYRRILIKDLRCGVSEKTVNKIDREAVFLAEEIMGDLMTACLAMDAGFTASVEYEDGESWYLGDSSIEGEANVKLSTTLEFEDAQLFADEAMATYRYILRTATKTQSLTVQDVYDAYYKAEVSTWNDSGTWMHTVNECVKNLPVTLVQQ